jgi:predicted RNase H-like HicB family nuclease
MAADNSPRTKEQLFETIVQVWWSAEDQAFLAQGTVFPGLMTHGETREEALKEYAIVLQRVLEDGAQLPPAS